MYSWDTLGSPHRSLARHIWNALSIYMTLLYILRSKVSLRYKTQCLNDTYMDRSGRSHKRLWFQYADWSSFQIIYSTRNWRINKIPDLFLLFLKKKITILYPHMRWGLTSRWAKIIVYSFSYYLYLSMSVCDSESERREQKTTEGEINRDREGERDRGRERCECWYYTITCLKWAPAMLNLVQLLPNWMSYLTLQLVIQVFLAQSVRCNLFSSFWSVSLQGKDSSVSSIQ